MSRPKPSEDTETWLAVIDHIHDCVLGTAGGWTSASVVSHGSHDVPRRVASSFPIEALDGSWAIRQGQSMAPTVQDRIDASNREIQVERVLAASLVRI